MSTPLTLAETASVFGETVTRGRLMALLSDPNEKFALAASGMDDAIATVFRQTAMNRFEHAVHTHRREVGGVRDASRSGRFLGRRRPSVNVAAI